MISIAYYDPVDIAVINGYAPLYDLLSFSAFYRFYCVSLDIRAMGFEFYLAYNFYFCNYQKSINHVFYVL